MVLYARASVMSGRLPTKNAADCHVQVELMLSHVSIDPSSIAGGDQVQKCVVNRPSIRLHGRCCQGLICIEVFPRI